jgi:hypothetical protein
LVEIKGLISTLAYDMINGKSVSSGGQFMFAGGMDASEKNFIVFFKRVGVPVWAR